MQRRPPQHLGRPALRMPPPRPTGCFEPVSSPLDKGGDLANHRGETAMSEATGRPSLLDREDRSLGDRLVGTWTTVLDNDGTPVVGLSSFSADGGVILTQLNAKNIGLGNWVATGPDTFTYNAHILAADETGGFKGTAYIRVSGTLTSATTWAGSGGATFHDPAGNPLRSHDGSTVTATKYGVEN